MDLDARSLTDLQGYIAFLEEQNQLIRVKTEVDPELELAFAKTVTVVDEDVDIYSPADVDWAVQTRCCHESDLLLIPDAIGHRLNPMVEDDKWTRLGIDATVPLPRPEKFSRATMADVDLSAYEITGI